MTLWYYPAWEGGVGALRENAWKINVIQITNSWKFFPINNLQCTWSSIPEFETLDDNDSSSDAFVFALSDEGAACSSKIRGTLVGPNSRSASAPLEEEAFALEVTTMASLALCSNWRTAAVSDSKRFDHRLKSNYKLWFNIEIIDSFAFRAISSNYSQIRDHCLSVISCLFCVWPARWQPGMQQKRNRMCHSSNKGSIWLINWYTTDRL